MWKPVSGIIFMLLLLGALISTFNFGLVQAQTPETVYINSDGSISPSSAPISTFDNVTYSFTGNIAYPTYDGVVVGKNNIVIDGNGHTVQGKGYADFTTGIDVSGTANVTVENTTITAFEDGISIGTYSSIYGNNITNNAEKGIYIGSPFAPGNGNSFSTNGLYSSVDGNNITNNGYGAFFFSYSSGNSVNGNNITASTVFVDDFTSGNSVSGNTFVDCGLAGAVYSISVTNNTVNGKPLVYLRSEKNYTVGSAGQVILISCDNITVENLNLSNADIGMLLDDISNSTISQNNLSYDSYDGIKVLSSSSTSICGNNITKDDNMGVYLGSSFYDSFCGNNLANDYYGIYLDSSSNNSISGNNVTGNGYAGILVRSSSNNSIYHNNFVNNTVQALDFSFSQPELTVVPSSDIWDDGYPSGGNYWSYYNGTDNYSGQYQNITGSDGISDTPYIIDANNTDNYPLMNPYPKQIGTPASLPQWLVPTILIVAVGTTIFSTILYRKRRVPVDNHARSDDKSAETRLSPRRTWKSKHRRRHNVKALLISLAMFLKRK